MSKTRGQAVFQYFVLMMSNTASVGQIEQVQPEVLPITTEQYETLVDAGAFEGMTGQIELIHGRIVRMNPQGPGHADPIVTFRGRESIDATALQVLSTIDSRPLEAQPELVTPTPVNPGQRPIHVLP